MMDTSVWFMLAYTAGTALGMWFGFKRGVMIGCEATVDMLERNNVIRKRYHPNGLEEILTIEEIIAEECK